MTDENRIDKADKVTQADTKEGRLSRKAVKKEAEESSVENEMIWCEPGIGDSLILNGNNPLYK